MSETHAPTSTGALMEEVIIKGDLRNLSEEQRVNYYIKVCESTGLNPFTEPFEYLILNGKMRLYAKKGATDQLRKIYDISVIDLSEQTIGDLYVVTVKVTDKAGRTDIDKGAVTIKNLTGDNLVNAMLKAVTKAKRRATLSICGLGMLDETEVESIPGARIVPVEGAIAAHAAPPEPTTSAPQPAARSQDEKAGVSLLHEALAKRGYNDPNDREELHRAVQRIARHFWPDLPSLTELTAAMTTDLAGLIAEASDDDLGFWEIEQAQSMEELIAIAQSFGRIGISRKTHPELQKAWNLRSNALARQAAHRPVDQAA